VEKLVMRFGDYDHLGQKLDPRVIAQQLEQWVQGSTARWTQK
jgi:hypothetical protein